ncbi:tetratricopeptide repeat protein, partial [Eudoraea sp.]|uniref:tetratricopeptide repeat protein n=1 Tax=Eudoraea sp. TaxID=1979955 RepID=UPI003C70DD84
YITDKNYNEALPFLQELESTANITQNRTFAQSNLMKGYYEKNEYDKTIVYADKVLANEGIDDRIKSDAQIMIARSAIATDNENTAETAYAEVLKIATGSLAAEALYYKAYFERKAGNVEASNESVQRLAKDFASYKEWGGKGLIIMAKNYDNLDDAYQATYILESVINNFSDYPEIVIEAKEELAINKKKEAERNSSILQEGN